jgi:hypothetical protein
MILMSDSKAPLGVWGAIPDLKQYLHHKQIPVRL